MVTSLLHFPTTALSFCTLHIPHPPSHHLTLHTYLLTILPSHSPHPHLTLTHLSHSIQPQQSHLLTISLCTFTFSQSHTLTLFTHHTLPKPISSFFTFFCTPTFSQSHTLTLAPATSTFSFSAESTFSNLLPGIVVQMCPSPFISRPPNSPPPFTVPT